MNRLRLAINIDGRNVEATNKLLTAIGQYNSKIEPVPTFDFTPGWGEATCPELSETKDNLNKKEVEHIDVKEPETVEGIEDKPKTESLGKITKGDLQALFAEKMADKEDKQVFKAVVKNKLIALGADNFTDLKESDYFEFNEFLKGRNGE